MEKRVAYQEISVLDGHEFGLAGWAEHDRNHGKREGTGNAESCP